jgi:hypothetical protein
MKIINRIVHIFDDLAAYPLSAHEFTPVVFGGVAHHFSYLCVISKENASNANKR